PVSMDMSAQSAKQARTVVNRLTKLQRLITLKEQKIDAARAELSNEKASQRAAQERVAKGRMKADRIHQETQTLRHKLRRLSDQHAVLHNERVGTAKREEQLNAVFEHIRDETMDANQDSLRRKETLREASAHVMELQAEVLHAEKALIAAKERRKQAERNLLDSVSERELHLHRMDSVMGELSSCGSGTSIGSPVDL
ncbi:hypothetical protein KIPB_011108, partial [Kipferlia bialata]